ncbi:MAG: tyrosine-type recombinase/integrase [Thermodesulfovibrionales bacterium]|jgi:integrase/recombinase XerD|nr:tyrosine-type recombinase/integrase [Thermodesulfovibrionales bacterium]
MKLIKRKNGYYYIYLDRLRSVSLKTNDEVLAHQIFEQEKTRYRGNKVSQIEKIQGITLSRFRNEYLKLRQLQDITQETRDNDTLAFRKFIDAVGDINLRQVTKDTINEFKLTYLNRGDSKVYLDILMRSLRTAFNYALDKGYIDKNPFLKERGEPSVFFRIDKELPRFLQLNEIDALFNAIDNSAFLLAIKIYLYTGIKRSELIKLTMQDIDMQNGFIYVRGTKGKKDRAIPINDELKTELLKYQLPEIGFLFTQWRNADTISRLFHYYCTKAGIKAKLRDLRHSFGSYLIMNGTDIKKVKELLGHGDIKTTEIYAKLTKEHLVEAVNKLSFGS